MYERRVHIRVPVGVEGSYHPVDRLASPQVGITRDLSMGGSRFASQERLEPGRKVSVVLNLPRQGQVTLTGLVVWCREADQPGQINFESGLQWSNLDSDVQNRLNRFLTEYTRGESVVIVSGPPVSKPISWMTALTIGVLLFAVLAVWLKMWIQQSELATENRALKASIKVYQDHEEVVHGYSSPSGAR